MSAETNTKTTYRHYAFISYSSKDIKWAKRLQRMLETYRLPVRLRKEHMPDKVYPVFRDDTDLSGFKVRPSLQRELEDSRYLIVICSPNSAASQWVNDEVEYFISLGRGDRILPFIIGGKAEAAASPPPLHASGASG